MFLRAFCTSHNLPLNYVAAEKLDTQVVFQAPLTLQPDNFSVNCFIYRGLMYDFILKTLRIIIGFLTLLLAGDLKVANREHLTTKNTERWSLERRQ